MSTTPTEMMKEYVYSRKFSRTTVTAQHAGAVKIRASAKAAEARDIASITMELVVILFPFLKIFLEDF